METVRESWTDERMDDLKEQVVEQGRRVDARFTAVDARFDSFEARVDARFDSMQRSMIQLFAVGLATFVGLLSVQTALLLALL
jgi:hypothetical protein